MDCKQLIECEGGGRKNTKRLSCGCGSTRYIMELMNDYKVGMGIKIFVLFTLYVILVFVLSY